MQKNSVIIPSTPIDKAAEQPRILWFIRPSIVVACLYVLFIGMDMFLNHHDIRYYVHIGPRFALHQPHAAPGYDGQFYYQIALHPLHATSFLDHPAYRYQRIVYPLLVAVLSLRQEWLIPFMLLLVNFLAIVLGTELLARLLSRWRLSPWFSLAFGLYFGQATAFIFDTTEPLTYFFVCLGLFLLIRQRITSAALSMGLAVLSRETAILFPLGYLIQYLFQLRWREVLRLLLLSIVPTLVWYIIIAQLFRGTGLTTAPAFQPVPFEGLFAFSHDPHRFRPLIILMFIPTVLSWLLLFKEALQGCWKCTSWLIWLFNLIMVSCMSPLSYVELVSAGRLSTGLVLAMLLHGLYTKKLSVLWACQIYTLMFFYYALGILYPSLHLLN